MKTEVKRKNHRNWIWKKRAGVMMAMVLGASVALMGCGASSTANNTATTSEVASEQSTDKTVVKIGYLPITHALALFEEAEQINNSDANIQIELTKFGSWTDLTDALNAGRIDGASVLIELAMNAVERGIDLKAVALGHKDGNVVVVSNDIQSVEDLKGKTFAIPSPQSSHNILLNDMLSSAGLTTDDLKITQLAPAEMPSSLASGAIDGYCVAEPFGAQAVEKELGHVLYESNDLWEDSQCCAFVLRNDFIQANQEAANTLIDDYFAAGKSLDETTALAVAEKYLGQEKAVLEASLQWISYQDLELTADDYQVLRDKVVGYHISENPPTYEDFVYQRGENNGENN